MRLITGKRERDKNGNLRIVAAEEGIKNYTQNGIQRTQEKHVNMKSEAAEEMVLKQDQIKETY